MDWREYVRQTLTDITGDPARDNEIIEELAQHLASRFDEIRGEGASEQDALERVGVSFAAARNLRQPFAAPIECARSRPYHLPSGG